jgi:muconolactone delta-isomerase
MDTLQLFLVEFDITDIDDKLAHRIPEQHELLLRLMQSGTVTNFAVSADRQKLWVFFRVQDMSELLRTISSFPLVNYLRPTFHPLLFQESAVRLAPMSLN